MVKLTFGLKTTKRKGLEKARLYNEELKTNFKLKKKKWNVIE